MSSSSSIEPMMMTLSIRAAPTRIQKLAKTVGPVGSHGDRGGGRGGQRSSALCTQLGGIGVLGAALAAEHGHPPRQTIPILHRGASRLLPAAGGRSLGTVEIMN